MILRGGVQLKEVLPISEGWVMDRRGSLAIDLAPDLLVLLFAFTFFRAADGWMDKTAVVSTTAGGAGTSSHSKKRISATI
jgi:hypothetical protein